ncbi:MAG: GNAT family N-acetyltransferase [Eubacteriales bacterium]|nr:GNAT family N-acetyltransferase [Eubacteriales bacterium]
MNIRTFEGRDLPSVIRIWQESVQAGEVVFYELTAEYFRTKFENDPNYDPQYSLVAEENHEIVGFINGVAKKIFLDHETNENSPGYITCFFVRSGNRGYGIGKALVDALCQRFKAAGKKSVAICNDNPINLDWHIPNTPGHDHNNTPGMDMSSPGYEFVKAIGFEKIDREIAMYLDLKDYIPWDGMKERQAQLMDQGVYTGRYDPRLGYDYDRLCDRVGSEYWREVIRSELACWQENRPNTDVRFIPNGTKIPNGPRPLLVATCDRHIVAFTGPVDKQSSGRGWFCGIFTDPEYEHRSIAPILFHLLMEEFIAEGATFSTLFTGENNRAQTIYLRTGFRIARRFALMKRTL